LPSGQALPPPDNLFLEIEAAKKHGGWSAWVRLTMQERALLLAHEMHLNLREHYECDLRKQPATPAKTPADNAPWTRMRNTFLGGGHNVAREK